MISVQMLIPGIISETEILSHLTLDLLQIQEDFGADCLPPGGELPEF